MNTNKETKMPEHSKGSKLGLVGGLVVTVAFFLPWMRSCSREFSGYDIATNAQIQYGWIFGITLLSGLVCVGLYFLVKTTSPRSLILSAIGRLIAGLVGALPVLDMWLVIQQRTAEIAYGGWIVTAGTLMILASPLIEIGEIRAMKDAIMQNPKSRWLLPILVAACAFFCTCLPLNLVSNLLLASTLGYVPTGFEEGLAAGSRAGAQNPVYGLVSTLTCCLPLLLMIGGGIGSFLYVDSYQRKQRSLMGDAVPLLPKSSSDKSVNQSTPVAIRTAEKKCAHCGLSNPADFKFCRECGTPLFAPPEQVKG